MPARFRIFVSNAKVVDCFTIVDCKPTEHGERYYGAFNHQPFHPQGFGQHGAYQPKDWNGDLRHLGKRIYVVDLPTKQARQFALQFMESCKATKTQVQAAMGKNT
jgi:hypothetical protein